MSFDPAKEYGIYSTLPPDDAVPSLSKPREKAPAAPKAANGVHGNGVHGVLAQQEQLAAAQINQFEQQKQERQNIYDKSAPKAPDIKPYQPPAPTDPWSLWGSPAMWLAGLAGFVGRRSIVKSLNAAAGVIDATNKGDEKAREESFRIWKQENENAEKRFEYEKSLYDIALGNWRDKGAEGKAQFETLNHMLGVKMDVAQMEHKEALAFRRQQDQWAHEAKMHTRELLTNEVAQTTKSTYLKEHPGDTVGAAKAALSSIAGISGPTSMSWNQMKSSLAQAMAAQKAAGGMDPTQALAESMRQVERLGQREGGSYRAMLARQIKEQHPDWEPGRVASYMASLDADSASLRKQTVQMDVLDSLSDKAVKNGEYLYDMSKRVDSAGVPVVQRWLNAGMRSITGDADVSEFDAQMQIYKAEIARLLTNPSGVLTVEALKEADRFLNTGMTSESIKRVVDRLASDVENGKKSTASQISAIKERMTSEDKKAVKGLMSDADKADSLAAAAAKVRKNPEFMDAVKKRLQENGIDPDELDEILNP